MQNGDIKNRLIGFFTENEAAFLLQQPAFQKALEECDGNSVGFSNLVKQGVQLLLKDYQPTRDYRS